MSLITAQQFPEALRSRLSGALPGIEAQYKLAPSGRPRTDYRDLEPSVYAESAVLIVLCRDEASWFVPLIQRPEYDGYHSGQIAFPGGKRDAGDSTLRQTAIRESDEEIGIGPECEILGALTPLYIPVSRYVVHPYVAVHPSPDPPIKPHAREVRSVVKLPLDLLTDPAFETTGDVFVSGLKMRVPCFDLTPHRIWGATAMMLSEFREILRDVRSTF